MPRMGDLADLANAFDVPLDQGTNVGWANRLGGWANRLGEILTTRPTYDESTIYKTASPLVNITEGDIGRATEAAMGVSGGGMKVETPRGIRAYHSSPHDFDRFDLARIGTGEGAQAYGHGLYFAESPAVSGQGGQYWQQFLPRMSADEQAAAGMLRNEAFNRKKAIEYSDWNLAQLRQGAEKGELNPYMMKLYAERQRQHDLLLSGKPVGPRTYEVNINADPAHMLDWDKPLSQMSPEVQENLRKAWLAHPEGHSRQTGGQIYESSRLVRGDYRDPAAATKKLQDAGIPGIKYLDQGSRAAGTGSSNFVVFDPSIIDIMKKYGIAGAAPAGMGALAAQDEYRP